MVTSYGVSPGVSVIGIVRSVRATGLCHLTGRRCAVRLTADPSPGAQLGGFSDTPCQRTRPVRLLAGSTPS